MCYQYNAPADVAAVPCPMCKVFKPSAARYSRSRPRLLSLTRPQLSPPPRRLLQQSQPSPHRRRPSQERRGYVRISARYPHIPTLLPVKSFNGCGYCKVSSLSSLRSPPSSPPSATVGSLEPETHRVQQPWLARLLPSPHPNRTPSHSARRLAHRQHRTQHTHAPRDKIRPRRYPRQGQPPSPHHLLCPCTTPTPAIHHPRSPQQHQQSNEQTLFLLKDLARRHPPPRSFRRQSRPPELSPCSHDPPRFRSAHALSSPDYL